MTAVIKNILGIVIAAAICGIAATLWEINNNVAHLGERLTRIETKLWPDK
jgi:hypothetical protein